MFPPIHSKPSAQRRCGAARRTLLGHPGAQQSSSQQPKPTAVSHSCVCSGAMLSHFCAAARTARPPTCAAHPAWARLAIVCDITTAPSTIVAQARVFPLLNIVLVRLFALRRFPEARTRPLDRTGAWWAGYLRAALFNPSDGLSFTLLAGPCHSAPGHGHPSTCSSIKH
jgi:hypothetical protein